MSCHLWMTTVIMTLLTNLFNDDITLADIDETVAGLFLPTCLLSVELFFFFTLYDFVKGKKERKKEKMRKQN